MTKKRGIIIMCIFFLFLVISLFVPHFIINQYSEGKIYSDLIGIPKNKVGLVLGTAKKLQDGRINLYFKYRVQAAAQLFHAKKIEYILVSGDNGRTEYDEPSDFKDELIKNGVPEEKIYLDFAGFRTLDSVIRAKEIFGQKKITIISQKFHNQRALYLAERNGLNAIGFNAKDVRGRYGAKVRAREYLARIKVFIDILFGTKPKFLGEKIVIPD